MADELLMKNDMKDNEEKIQKKPEGVKRPIRFLRSIIELAIEVSRRAY